MDNNSQDKTTILADFNEGIRLLLTEKTQSGLWIELPKISIEEEQQIQEFAKNSLPVKQAEEHHINDNKKEWERLTRGKDGEWALRSYLGLKKPDLNIGSSLDFNVSDIEDYYGKKIGIKTSQLGNAALIHKKPVRPEIILIGLSSRWFIAGVADVTILKECQNDNLLRIATNYKKTGLTLEGYKRLIPFSVYKKDIISEYYKNNKDKKCKTGRTVEEELKNFDVLLNNKKFQEIYTSCFT
jgi:hypothetical protein